MAEIIFEPHESPGLTEVTVRANQMLGMNPCTVLRDGNLHLVQQGEEFMVHVGDVISLLPKKLSYLVKKRAAEEETVPTEALLDSPIMDCITGKNPDKLLERYLACMVLAAVGDAIGYNNGTWEFNFDGEDIHKQAADLGGIEKMSVKGRRVSDDTVMHIATAEACVAEYEFLPQLIKDIAIKYVDCRRDMGGRAPGATTMTNLKKLAQYTEWEHFPNDIVEYSRSGGGCGGSMRTMCIGLRYSDIRFREFLYSAAIESSRLTHNHPTAVFGAVASALFTALAIEEVPPIRWGYLMLLALKDCYSYLEDMCTDWEKYQKDLKFFEDKLRAYLELRNIVDGKGPAVFPEVYGIKERDAFYKSLSWDGWGGASGHDSVIIAYDAFLGCDGDWCELLRRGAMHSGDNDSTGTIAAGWFGALYGFTGVPQCHWQSLEYRPRLERLASQLLQRSRKDVSALKHKHKTKPKSEKKRPHTEEVKPAEGEGIQE